MLGMAFLRNHGIDIVLGLAIGAVVVLMYLGMIPA